MTTTQTRGDGRGTSILLITALMLATLAASAAPVNAGPLDREITVSGPTALIPGENATYGGQLTHVDTGLGLPFHDVEMFRDGVAVATATTNLSGMYAVELGFPDAGTFDLVTRAYGGTPLMLESPALSVDVRNVFELTLSGPTQLDVGQSGTFSGTLLMNGNGMAGEQVEILRLGTPVASTSTDDAGIYSLSVPFPEAGIFQFVARALSGSPDVVTSPELTVLVVGPTLAAVSMAAGDKHSCVSLTDGTVHCWGDNEHGQLGDGTNTDRLTATLVPGISSAVSLAAGGGSTCALVVNGTVYCWGDNEFGQLGDGTTTGRNTPAPVVGLTGVMHLGGNHADHLCAVVVDGTAVCWGWNQQGQLGDGSTTDRSTPVPVSNLTDVVSIATGYAFTCAVVSNGTAYCWGANLQAQLGDGTRTPHHEPAPVADLTNASAIALGAEFACATTDDAAMYCWGANSHGQFGDGTTTSRVGFPRLSGFAEVEATGLGLSHTCAATMDGSLYCAGNNYYGQLGDGSTAGRPNPVTVALPQIEVVAAGTAHTCAAGADGGVWCWGENSSGQVGDGSTAFSVLTPQAVVGLPN